MNPVLRLDHRYHDVEDHDRGLVYDLATLDRRRMLKLLGLGGISAGLFTIVGCNPSASSATPGATATAAGASQGTGATGSADAASCEVIPEETAGPFPGDGSNGPDVLSQTRRRPQGHPVELRVVVGRRRRRSALDQPRARGRRRLRAARRRGGLRLALRPGRQLLAVLAGRGERELPPRRPGRRRRRRRDVRLDLPGLLPGPLAAHPLRGLSQPRDRERRGEQDRDLPDRAAEGRLRHGLRDRRATSRASRTWARLSLQSDMVFGDDGGVHQLGTMSGDVAGGYAVRLTVPVNG